MAIPPRPTQGRPRLRQRAVEQQADDAEPGARRGGVPEHLHGTPAGRLAIVEANGGKTPDNAAFWELLCCILSAKYLGEEQVGPHG